MDDHDIWAEELIERYPKATRMMTVEQVKDAWEAYSDCLAAGWMDHDGLSEEEVEYNLQWGLRELKKDRPKNLDW